MRLFIDCIFTFGECARDAVAAVNKLRDVPVVDRSTPCVGVDGE